LGRGGGIRSQQSSRGATYPVFGGGIGSISPGLIEGTQMSAGAPDEFVALWRYKSILGATTSIDDVAQQVLTFCKSPSVTGQTVVIDGGIHLD
jgi:3-oxoacyl-[acyl-carrier protein] reductase